ncbi:hypothetical protein JOC70_003188 [Clostridium pascui]|uniref:transmembrane-type terpene cyclase n=1 Tax=Clostridium pascui TaxID=46609 RepID=UPI00195CC966|nr:hypothetical protein [Clostridium pascui]MBM7871678.1 hypothetical protein [Clostridium pascui]
MVLFLTLLGGICWTIVYIELIRLGFKDKTYGMPFIALALNIAWETIYSYISIKDNPTSVQSWIILIWFLLDALIVYTYLRYGKKYFPKRLGEKYFMLWNGLIFLMSFVIQYYFIVEFGDLGGWYSAFFQNLIMSILFINMIVRRMNTEGQNLTIAINKWIGTLAPTILFGLIYENKLVLVLGIFCSVFDIIYISLLNNAKKTSFSRSKTFKA